MTNQRPFRQNRMVTRFAWPWRPITLEGKTRRFGFVRIQQITNVMLRDGQIVGTEWRDWKILP